MSLSKNQLELLKIAKDLVGMVIDEDIELAQDEEENLNHVKRLLDWHTADKVEQEKYILDSLRYFGCKLNKR